MSSEKNLIAYVTNQIGKPFALGKNDCALFMFGCIDAFTSSNLHDSYQGKWHDKKSAANYVKAHGGATEHLLALGFDKVDEDFVQIGDVIMSEDAYIPVPSPSVCIGDKVAALTIDGLCFTQISQLTQVKGVYRCPQ